jgi:small-conductance mechanosensitive channel
VLADQPVDVLFYEYGVSARRVRVRWWITNSHQEKHIIDRMNQALEIAFDQAGIVMPVTTRNLNVSMWVDGGPPREPSSLERAPSLGKG